MMVTRRKQKLQEAGIDVEAAMERMMQNEELFVRCLGRFLKDENYGRLKSAFASGDREAALQASHTLKGVCGNLSMDRLFELLQEQVQLLRSAEWERAEKMMPQIEEQYGKMVRSIEESRQAGEK